MAGKTFTSETSSWWVAALAGTGSNLLYSPSGQELYESQKGQGIHRNFDRRRSFPLNNTEGPRQKYPPQAGSVLHLHMYLVLPTRQSVPGKKVCCCLRRLSELKLRYALNCRSVRFVRCSASIPLLPP